MPPSRYSNLRRTSSTPESTFSRKPSTPQYRLRHTSLSLRRCLGQTHRRLSAWREAKLIFPKAWPIPQLRVAMQIHHGFKLCSGHSQVVEHIGQVRLGELTIIAPDKLQSLLAGQVPVLDHPGRHPCGAAEAELDVHHVVVQIVDLVVDTVEALKAAVGRSPPVFSAWFLTPPVVRLLKPKLVP